MNNLRSKKTRHAMRVIAGKYGSDVERACVDKLAMKNRFGQPQHRVINPLRQLKKAVLRMGLA